MYELLLRIETLFAELGAAAALIFGAIGLIVGLMLWLAGSRYSAIILGVVGAIVGAFCGMLVDQLLELHLLLSMIIGAAVFAAASVLLRNILVIVLAVLVFAALSGAGYLTVALDKHLERDRAGETETAFYQSFAGMDYQSRLSYLNELSDPEQGLSERIRRLLEDTWQSLGPNRWKLVLAVFAGGIIGMVLVWFIRKAIIALAYSVVGAAVTVLGAQVLLLGVNVRPISALADYRTAVPIAFAVMIAVGWACQLLFGRKPQPVAAKTTKSSD